MELGYVTNSSISRAGRRSEPDLRRGFGADVTTGGRAAQAGRYDLDTAIDRDQSRELDVEAVECSQTEMVQGQGEMGRLQQGRQGPETIGAQELVVSLRLHGERLGLLASELCGRLGDEVDQAAW